jgi:hypothetical protein
MQIARRLPLSSLRRLATLWQSGAPRRQAMVAAPLTWIIAYFLFGLGDGALSLVAFGHGATEANPVLAWALEEGFFVPAKLLITYGVAGLMWVLRDDPRALWPMRFGAGVQMAVCLWQLIGLFIIIPLQR